MNILVAMTETSSGRFYTLSTDKAAMTVYVSAAGYVQACVDNAAARANRFNTGKVFHGDNALSAAIAAYKSSTSKAMLEAVQRAEQERAS